MEASLTLLYLAGNVALLLWGLHMVQGGIMRAFGHDLRRYLGVALRNRFKAFFAGLFATTLLQSSTATGLIASSFTASKLVGLVPAMALMLGANVGTTLIVQVFSFDISHVAPVFLLVGFIAYQKASRTSIRDFGKAILGLGLMLFSLEHMMALLSPAADSEGIKLLLTTISQDHLLDMIIAAVLTWIMHSSVAVVLIAISFATQGLIPVDVAFALVLGANLGSAINPFFESGSGNPSARRLPFGNLINRAAGCLIFLPMISFAYEIIPMELLQDKARAIATFHTAFNLALAMLFFPFLPLLAKFLEKLLPEKIEADQSAPLYLDMSVRDKPSLAIANAARETLRMADLAEKMLVSLMDLFANNDRKRIADIHKMDDIMDKLNRHVKNYITSLDMNKLTDAESKRMREVLAFTVNLEHIGDVISGGLVKLGAKKIERKMVFSQEGWGELKAMLERVTINARMASAVFMSRELRTAKQLMEEKGVIRDMENNATEMHFKRLRENRQESIETTGLHLDIVRDLKRINSHLTSIAAPILEENGQLLKSRMKAQEV